MKKGGQTKWITIIITLLILTACTKTKQTPTGTQVTDISAELTHCYVHKDYIACNTTNGQVMYATMKKINQITKYDCTMWKENPC